MMNSELREAELCAKLAVVIFCECV